MVRLSCPSSGGGYHTEFVAANNVARITEAGVNSQWHGIRSIVRLFDGGLLECDEPADTVRKLVDAELAAIARATGATP